MTNYQEEIISQIPALQLLMQMGYGYITPEEASAYRNQKHRSVILEPVLEAQLRKMNKVRYRGKSHDFTDSNIAEAIRQIRDVRYEGLITTNEKIYELLTLGTSLSQTIDGDTKSYSLKYIDWKNPENNVYHVTDEYIVEKPSSSKTRRPDIVLFINGIPVVVIECKRPDLEKSDGSKAVEEAITQMIRNQKDDEIYQLFLYSQLVLAVSKNDALYATTGTPKKFWSLWKEEEDNKEKIKSLISKELPNETKDRLYNHRERSFQIRNHFESLGERLPTPQDETIYSLLEPARLLQFIYQFTVYDNGIKKVARYQQFFSVLETIKRVAHLNIQGSRTGGVIWHTTGSGKSLTMVMLAKALSLHPNIKNPKVVLVTDRVDLDQQISDTFRACGKKAKQATSGRNLIKLVNSQTDIITTVVNKFETVAKEKQKDENPNIFVLVDESHRSQYGTTHAKMKQVFPNACYIGFTGTPLLKKEKSTAEKFGSFIHKYTMRQAVEDKAVVPLLYEGRMAEITVNQGALDKWFERVTRDLTPEQKVDLKKKLSRNEEVSQTEQRIKEIAYDISDHYSKNFQGTGFKAQLATSSKRSALLYQKAFDQFGIVTSAVVISPPDTREGNEEVDSDNEPELESFWKKMMRRYKTEDAYIKSIKNQFKQEDGLEILIVVDKLLTGFDEPRNTVLYIDKSLKEHNLLQAIARVNRLFEGKEFGHIVDYRGVLGRLSEAMETYEALEGYDSEDIVDTIRDVQSEIDQVPQLHSDLRDVFKTVGNKKDIEEFEQFLAPEDKRQIFYDALSSYTRALKVALASVNFYDLTPEKRVAKYKSDLRFFHNLRQSVKQRYAETVDYKDYEKKVRKLLDEHVRTDGTNQIVELVNIFDTELFDEQVAKIESPASKADTIAHRLKKTAYEKMDEDPAFYRRFAEMVEETIEEYRLQRMSDSEYLKKATELMNQMRDGIDSKIPEILKDKKHAPAYYGLLLEPISTLDFEEDKSSLIAKMAVRIEELIEEQKVRDWTHNSKAIGRMKRNIDDYLFSIKGRYNIPITGDMVDIFVDQLIDLAEKRNHLS